MKSVSAILIIAAAVITPAIAQQKQSAKKLTDSFAKAAILAVRAIQPPGVKAEEKIDAADSEAVSKGDEAVLSRIRLLYLQSKIAEMKRKEGELSPLTDCFNDFVENLRARSSVIPKSCPAPPPPEPKK